MQKITLNDYSHENDKKSKLGESLFTKELAELMGNIHADIPKCNANTYKIASFDEREEFFNDKNYKRAVVYIRSNGCEWAIKSGNGCTMCGHLSEQLRTEEPLSDEEYFAQFRSVFETIDYDEFPILNLYNNGSFFNNNEISEACRIKILKLIGSNEKLKMVVLESRPEFITLEVIENIKKYMPNTYVEIAIGFESYSDDVRIFCINKGFTRKTYEKAAKLIIENGGDLIKLRSYVLLKAPFLSEREAIDDAVRTIKYCFDLGCTTISIEGCTIQDYTLPQFLHLKGEYRTPWLWSIIEVLKQTAHLGKIIVGLFQFYPSASQVPHNCTCCNDYVLERIKDYNRTLDKNVFDNLTCECKKEWETELQIPKQNLIDRIEGTLKRAGKSL